MSGAAAVAAGLSVPGLLSAAKLPVPGEALDYVAMPGFSTDEEKTPFEDVTRYNNFYEFGTGKGDPAKYADEMSVDPWSIVVEGECWRPGKYALEDLLKPHEYQERVYRLRCVEAWSMVIPWIGIPLADVIKRLEPNSRAKYVYFETCMIRIRCGGSAHCSAPSTGPTRRA